MTICALFCSARAQTPSALPVCDRGAARGGAPPAGGAGLHPLCGAGRLRCGGAPAATGGGPGQAAAGHCGAVGMALEPRAGARLPTAVVSSTRARRGVAATGQHHSRRHYLLGRPGGGVGWTGGPECRLDMGLPGSSGMAPDPIMMDHALVRGGGPARPGTQGGYVYVPRGGPECLGGVRRLTSALLPHLRGPSAVAAAPGSGHLPKADAWTDGHARAFFCSQRVGIHTYTPSLSAAS